jgi:hypothetical protein
MIDVVYPKTLQFSYCEGYLGLSSSGKCFCLSKTRLEWVKLGYILEINTMQLPLVSSTKLELHCTK